MCAEQRRVCVAWVVSGAPNRTRMMARIGVARVRARVMDRRADCLIHTVNKLCSHSPYS